MTLNHAKAVLIVIAVLASYWPAFSAGFIWDDEWFIKSDPSFQGLSGLLRIWTDPTASFQYYPLVHTTFWIEWYLWHAQPAGYHIVNVLLHALNALLIWSVLARLGLRYAWLIGLAFAVHPVTVESVAWIAERKNVLYTFFYLVSMRFFVEAFRLGGGARDSGGHAEVAAASRSRSLVAGSAAYLFALLSKTVAATLPAVLLLLIFWKRRRPTRGTWLFIGALATTGAAFAGLTVALESGIVGARGDAWSHGLLERALVAGRAFWFYLGKIFYPHELTFIYPRWRIAADDPSDYLGLVFILVVIAALVAARRVIGRGPAVALLFFAVNVGPALGFLNVYPHRYSFVADHWQYLASVGILALVATILGAFVHKAGRWARPIAVAVATLCVAALIGASRSQCEIYESQDTLWRDTIEKNPTAWMAHTNLGALLLRRGEPDSAIVEFTEALRYKPDHHPALNNLGAALAEVGRTNEAIEAYKTALREEPDYFLSLTNLAGLYATHPDPRYRNLAEAERLALRACILSNYEHPDALKVLAAAYAGSGRLKEAIEVERKALEIARAARAPSMVQAIQQRIEAYERRL